MVAYLGFNFWFWVYILVFFSELGNKVVDWRDEWKRGCGNLKLEIVMLEWFGLVGENSGIFK